MLKSFDECIYYIVRSADGGPLDPVYLDHALEHMKADPKSLSPLELKCLVMAASRQGKLDELDRIFGFKGGD